MNILESFWICRPKYNIRQGPPDPQNRVSLFSSCIFQMSFVQPSTLLFQWPCRWPKRASSKIAELRLLPISLLPQTTSSPCSTKKIKEKSYPQRQKASCKWKKRRKRKPSTRATEHRIGGVASAVLSTNTKSNKRASRTLLLSPFWRVCFRLLWLLCKQMFIHNIIFQFWLTLCIP